MDILQIAVLALLQGLTEFLPISSSAHLILVPVLSDWPDQGLSFDVAVHVGTLSAVMLYFRRELAAMSVDWCRSLVSRRPTENSRLAWYVLWGTVPVGLCGLLGRSWIEAHLRSPLVIAVATLVFGVALWLSWIFGRRHRDEYRMTVWDVVWIGCAQALALIPGTSRSGITITAGLFRGLSAQAAARFSFLLSIPVIALAGALQVQAIFESGHGIAWKDLLLGAGLSAASAYVCIHYFLKLVSRVGMVPFVLYRLLLGAVLLYLFV